MHFPRRAKSPSNVTSSEQLAANSPRLQQTPQSETGPEHDMAAETMLAERGRSPPLPKDVRQTDSSASLAAAPYSPVESTSSGRTKQPHFDETRILSASTTDSELMNMQGPYSGTVPPALVVTEHRARDSLLGVHSRETTTESRNNINNSSSIGDIDISGESRRMPSFDSPQSLASNEASRSPDRKSLKRAQRSNSSGTNGKHGFNLFGGLFGHGHGRSHSNGHSHDKNSNGSSHGLDPNSRSNSVQGSFDESNNGRHGGNNYNSGNFSSSGDESNGKYGHGDGSGYGSNENDTQRPSYDNLHPPVSGATDAQSTTGSTVESTGAAAVFMALPKNKDIKRFVRYFPDLNANLESLIVTYRCALAVPDKKDLPGWQGKIFITKSYVCFHGRNIAALKKVLNFKIPLSEVTDIKKRATVGFVPCAIRVNVGESKDTTKRSYAISTHSSVTNKDYELEPSFSLDAGFHHGNKPVDQFDFINVFSRDSCYDFLNHCWQSTLIRVGNIDGLSQPNSFFSIPQQASQSNSLGGDKNYNSTVIQNKIERSASTATIDSSGADSSDEEPRSTTGELLGVTQKPYKSRPRSNTTSPVKSSQVDITRPNYRNSTFPRATASSSNLDQLAADPESLSLAKFPKSDTSLNKKPDMETSKENIESSRNGEKSKSELNIDISRTSSGKSDENQSKKSPLVICRTKAGEKRVVMRDRHARTHSGNKIILSPVGGSVHNSEHEGHVGHTGKTHGHTLDVNVRQHFRHNGHRKTSENSLDKTGNSSRASSTQVEQNVVDSNGNGSIWSVIISTLKGSFPDATPDEAVHYRWIQIIAIFATVLTMANIIILLNVRDSLTSDKLNGGILSWFNVFSSSNGINDNDANDGIENYLDETALVPIWGISPGLSTIRAWRTADTIGESRIRKHSPSRIKEDEYIIIDFDNDSLIKDNNLGKGKGSSVFNSIFGKSNNGGVDATANGTSGNSGSRALEEYSVLNSMILTGVDTGIYSVVYGERPDINNISQQVGKNNGTVSSVRRVKILASDLEDAIQLSETIARGKKIETVYKNNKLISADKRKGSKNLSKPSKAAIDFTKLATTMRSGLKSSKASIARDIQRLEHIWSEMNSKEQTS